MKRFPVQVKINNILVTAGMGLFSSLYERKYRFIINYLKNDCSDVIEKYKSLDYEPSGKIPKVIWSLWWQPESVPPIPDTCLERIAKIAKEKGFRFVVLSRENYSEFVDLSDVIGLYENNDISIQFLSDFIRIRLLRKYGGFWLDSTIAVADPEFFDDIIENMSFFSIKLAKLKKNSSVTRGYISSYLWASCENNPFWSYMDEVMTEFIRRHKQIIDYFQIDYSAMLGYYNIPFIQKMIDEIPPSNEQMFSLSPFTYEEFNKKTWLELLTTNQVFKLNWRRKIHSTPPRMTFLNYMASLSGKEKVKNE